MSTPRYQQPGAAFRIFYFAFEFIWLAVSLVGFVVVATMQPTNLLGVLLILTNGLFFLVLFPVVLLVYVRNRRRLRQRVRAAEYQPCVRCGHSLAGQPRHARCPECGTVQDTTKLRAFWIAHPGMRKKPVPTYLQMGVGLVAGMLWLVWTVLGVMVMSPHVFVASVFTLVPFALMIVGSDIFFVWQYVSLRRRLIRTRFRLCPRCGADLSSRPAAGKCKLCRRPYTWRELQQTWRTLFPVDWRRDVLETCRRAERVLDSSPRSYHAS